MRKLTCRTANRGTPCGSKGCHSCGCKASAFIRPVVGSPYSLPTARRECSAGHVPYTATTPVEGTCSRTARGTADRPIAIKGAGDGEVIFDGNGYSKLFNVKAGNSICRECVSIRNPDIALWAGTQF